MTPQPSEIEVVGLAAEDFLIGFLVLLALMGFVFAGGYLAGVWERFGRDEPEPAEVNDLTSATTVEIPTETPTEVRPRRHPRPPRTGTIHASQSAVDDSPTEVIRRPGGVAS